MKDDSFDLCKANCELCNGINVVSLDEDDIYICKNTEKLLQKIDDTTLTEL